MSIPSFIGVQLPATLSSPPGKKMVKGMLYTRFQERGRS